jgi:hypothetical protein
MLQEYCGKLVLNTKKKFQIFFPLILVLAGIPASTPAIMAQASSGAEAAPIQPPAHPITEQQLKLLFDEFGSAEAQKEFVRDTLGGARSRLPTWFPQSVWAEAVRDIENLDTFSIALPVYQKYLSEDNASKLILFYDGDTGRQLARAWTAHARQAMDQGYRGGNAALQAEDSMGKDQDVDALTRKRMSELGSERGNSCLDALQIFNQYIARINNEKNAIYMTKVQEIARRVAAEHKAELDAAQRKAAQGSVTR